MQQILFHIPIFKSAFPPDGLPLYAFGAMLCITFIVVTLWGTVRAQRIGMPAPKFQDFVVVILVTGFIGARVLYMIQYAHHFPDHSPLGLAKAFFKIWEGGIVFYGSALGGAIGYGFFYWFVMRKLSVSGWQLADAVAPLLALGLAIGRIGCYLNGCCWGQVACETCTVPLGSAHFPLLPGHMRSQLVAEQYLQTSTGFAITPRARLNPFEDPRALVIAVERDSPAAKADLRVGDRIARVNGEPNRIIADLSGLEERVKTALELAPSSEGVRRTQSPTGRPRVEFDELKTYLNWRMELDSRTLGLDISTSDRLEELVRDWPRGQSKLTLAVERNGRVEELPSFAPATIGLYPTQLYETVSMVLLIVLLLAYYPYRRHDGQLLVVLMVGYAVHRFINESLRIEPSYALGLTLSQWGSVIVLAAAIGIEVFLWRTMPSRWKAPPSSSGAPA